MRKLFLFVFLAALSFGGAQAQTVYGPPATYVSPGVQTLHYFAQAARTAAIANPQTASPMLSPPTVAAGAIWAISTAYAVNDEVVVFTGAGATAKANFYICTTAGTSAATGTGPSGTGTGIVDGTVTWAFVSVGPGAAYSSAGPHSYLWGNGTGLAGINGVVNYLGGTPTNTVTDNEKTQSSAFAGSLNVRFEFLTDSATPTVRMFSYVASAYRILVNGQPVSANPVTISHFPWIYIQLSFGSQKMRDITVEAIGGTGWFGGVDVAATEGVYKPNHPNGITLVGAGDSIMAGVGATYMGDGFFPRLCDFVGATNCVDTGIGGTGYIISSPAGTAVSRVGDVLAATSTALNPVVVDENVFNDCSGNYAAITSAVVTYVQTLRADGFAGPIFELGMYATNAGGASWAPGVSCDNAKAAAVKQLNDPLVFFIPDIGAAGGSWFTGTGDTTAPNGTGNSDVYVNGANLPHPSEAGHYFYAVNVADAIDSILAGY